MTARDVGTALLVGAVGWGVQKAAVAGIWAGEFGIMRWLVPDLSDRTMGGGPSANIFFIAPICLLLLAAVVVLIALGRRALWWVAAAAFVLGGVTVAAIAPLSPFSLLLFAIGLTMAVPLALGAATVVLLLGLLKRRTQHVYAVTFCFSAVTLAWAMLIMFLPMALSIALAERSWSLSTWLASVDVTVAYFVGYGLLGILLGALTWRLLADEHRNDITPLAAVAVFCGLMIAFASVTWPLRLWGVVFWVIMLPLPAIALWIAGQVSGPRPAPTEEVGSAELIN